MEIDDQSTPENPDKVTSVEQAGASPVRSYDCTFCKRGFSNAQALGGHMNIHRKDKAKLKQASTNTQNPQPLNIQMILPYFSTNPTNIIRPSMEEHKGGASQERSPRGWPWMLAEENDATNVDKTHREVRQLPLFIERTVTSDQNPSNQVRGNPEKLLSSSASSGPELDLELRLGPEPGESSPSATSTKKFF